MLLVNARADRGADLRDYSSDPRVRDRTELFSGAYEINRKGGVSVVTLPPVAIVTSTRLSRTEAINDSRFQAAAWARRTSESTWLERAGRGRLRTAVDIEEPIPDVPMSYPPDGSNPRQPARVDYRMLGGH